MHGVLLGLPFLGRFFCEAALARFARTMATLQKGGLTIVESLLLSEKTLFLLPLRGQFSAIRERVIEGEPFSEALKSISFLPQKFVHMVRIGEEAGDLTKVFFSIADSMEHTLEQRLSRFSAILQPAILIVMGFFVGLLLLAILLPFTDISSLSL